MIKMVTKMHSIGVTSISFGKVFLETKSQVVSKFNGIYGIISCSADSSCVFTPFTPFIIKKKFFLNFYHFFISIFCNL